MSAHLAWAKGGEASFLTVDDDAVTLRSTIPSPPGSRLEGKLASGDTPIKIKIHGSKLEPDGSFTLKGRLLDASRGTRDRVASLVIS
ncbi:MAG: hypothetical protein KF819_11525 [Labilithrix sp.]|nr:hypothetical protein [Labilithrix sp.]